MTNMTPTSPQAVSRVIRKLGMGRALDNRACRVSKNADGTVRAVLYPGSPETLARRLRDQGYVVEIGHRSVIVRGKARDPSC